LTEKKIKRGAATLFGAPISWVALFGAILGATSIVPVFFFAQGGAYIPLSQLLSTIAGLVLGPYAGFVAYFIGCIIALFIAPASLPGGLIMVPIQATYALWAGLALMKPKSKAMILMIIWTIVGLAIYNMFPYVWPGPAAGFPRYPVPEWFYYEWYFFLGAIIICSPIYWYYVPTWVRSENVKTRTFGMLWVYFIAQAAAHAVSQWVIIYTFAMPPQVTMFVTGIAVPFQHTTLTIAAGMVGSALLTALRKAGLREIPRVCW
jgi:hypothetical protein